MNKTVSVIVATYRREQTLKKALMSLAEQSYGDIEIVLVDDNADKAWNQRVNDIAESFQEEYPNVKLVCLTNTVNLGSAKTRNKGIENSSGEYITFLDDDDVYLPQKVENQVRFMERNKLDYCVTDLDLYYENGKLAEHKTRSYIKRIDRKSLFEYHLMYHITGPDTMMFRKDYLGQIAGFAPIDVGDDFYLMQRAIENDGNFGYLPVCDVRALVHISSEGLSSGDGKIKGENQLYLHKKNYFKQLSRRNRRYITMRHYAVLAFAYMRSKKMFSFLKNAAISFFVAPIQCLHLILGRKL